MKIPNINEWLQNENSNNAINECVIAHTVLNKNVILAKNRDRAYKASIKIVRELVNDVEIVYINDVDTDWSEGMNSFGIGVINSALMVESDEQEKKIVSKSGKTSDDGEKIRRSLLFKDIQDTVNSIKTYVGRDKKDVGVKGHTFVASCEESYSIESTSKNKPVVTKLDRNENHVRTNHGFDLKGVGYKKGASKESSEKRMQYAYDALENAKKPIDILDGLSDLHTVNLRNNPYRDAEKVKNKTKKDVLSTTGQILMNLTELEFIFRYDNENSKFVEIDDKTPKDYKTKIKITVEKTVKPK